MADPQYFISPTGVLGSVPAEHADAATQAGYRQATDDEVEHARLVDKFSGPTGAAAEFIQSLGSTITLGGTDWLNRKIHEVAPRFGRSAEELSAMEEAQPEANIVGTIAGFFTPNPIGGLIGGVGKGVGGAVGRAAASAGAGRITSAIARGAATGATEAELYDIGHVAHEQALGDPRGVAESLVSEAGPSLLFGGALGSVTGGVGGLAAKLGEDGLPIWLKSAEARFGGKQAAAGGGKRIFETAVDQLGREGAEKALRDGPDILGTLKSDGPRQVLDRTKPVLEDAVPKMDTIVDGADNALPFRVKRTGLQSGNVVPSAEPEFRQFLREAREKVLTPMASDPLIGSSARRLKGVLDEYEQQYLGSARPTLRDLWNVRQGLDNFAFDVTDTPFSEAAVRLRGIASDALETGLDRAGADVGAWKTLLRRYHVAKLYEGLANEGLNTEWNKGSLGVATGLGFVGSSALVHSLGGGLLGAGLTAASTMAARRYGFGLLNWAARRLRTAVESGKGEESFGVPPIGAPPTPSEPPLLPQGEPPNLSPADLDAIAGGRVPPDRGDINRELIDPDGPKLTEQQLDDIARAGMAPRRGAPQHDLLFDEEPGGEPQGSARAPEEEEAPIDERGPEASETQPTGHGARAFSEEDEAFAELARNSNTLTQMQGTRATAAARRDERDLMLRQFQILLRYPSFAEALRTPGAAPDSLTPKQILRAATLLEQGAATPAEANEIAQGIVSEKGLEQLRADEGARGTPSTEETMRPILQEHAAQLGIPEPMQAAAVEQAIQSSARKAGNVSTIVTPARLMGEPARYRILDVDDLIQSHLPDGFAPNPEYPPNVQTRNYQTDKAERQKVEAPTGGKFNPDFVLAQSPEPISGAPIVTSGPKALVLGGNGRTMIMKRAFRDPEVYADYLRQLRERLSSFGLSEADLAGVKRPVLVREVDLAPESPLKDLQDAVHRYNQGLTQELRPAQKYAAMARTLTPELMGRIGEVMTDNGEMSLREIMAEKPASMIGVLDEAGLINRTNRQAYVTDNGRLTDLAKDEIEGMFRAKVLGEGDRVEQTPDALKRKVERIAPYLVRVASANPELDEIPVVQEALDRINAQRVRMEQARRSGLAGKNAAGAAEGQNDLFNKPPSPGPADKMADLLQNTGALDLQARFKAWAAAASQERRQTGMFAVAPPSPEKIRSLLSPEYGAAALLAGLGAGAALTYRPQTDAERKVASDTADLMASERNVAMSTAMHDQSQPYQTEPWANGADPSQPLPQGPVSQTATGRPEAFRLLGKIREVIDRQQDQIQQWASTAVRAGPRSASIERGATFAGLSRSSGAPTESLTKQYETAVATVNRLAADPNAAGPALTAAAQPLDEHAPTVAQETRNTLLASARFLASKVPQPLQVAPMAEPLPPSRQEMSTWLTYRDAVESPADLLRWTAAGTLLPAHVEAVEAVYPQKLQSMRQAVLEQLGRHGTPPLSQWTAIETLMGQPMFRSTSSSLASAAAYASAAAPPPQAAPSSAGAGRASTQGRKAAAASLTTTQRITSGSTSPAVGIS